MSVCVFVSSVSVCAHMLTAQSVCVQPKIQQKCSILHNLGTHEEQRLRETAFGGEPVYHKKCVWKGEMILQEFRRYQRTKETI